MSDKFDPLHPAGARRNRRHRRLYFLGLGALCFGVLLSESISAWGWQAPKKVFEAGADPRPKPVKLVELRAANRPVRLGEKFEGASDWLHGATFKLRNDSGKEIVYLELDLNFPETAYTGSEMSFSIKAGRRPGGPGDLKEPLSVKPNGELVFSLDEKKYKELSDFVGKRHRLSEVNQVRVEVGFVVFGDGTAWGAGSYYRQDPANPNRYVPVGDTPPAN